MRILAVLLVAVILGFAWWWLRRTSAPRQASPGAASKEMVSLVFLLSKRRDLNRTSVERTVSDALDVRFEPDNKDARDFVVPMPQLKVDRDIPAEAGEGYMIKVRGQIFILHNFSVPYLEDPETFAGEISDARLRQAVANHKAWLSVDLLDTGSSDKAKAYQAIGRIMAELAGEDCLAIFCPELSRCNEYDAGLLDVLRSDDPLRLFDEPTFAPIVEISGDDPRMVAAVAEARKRWPEFAQAFRENRDPERPFLIKAVFSEDEHTEFMWVTVRRIQDDTIEGTLENTPAKLTGIKEGDTVKVNVSDLNDWVYPKGQEAVGGFTMKVIGEMHK